MTYLEPLHRAAAELRVEAHFHPADWSHFVNLAEYAVALAEGASE